VAGFDWLVGQIYLE